MTKLSIILIFSLILGCNLKKEKIIFLDKSVESVESLRDKCIPQAQINLKVANEATKKSVENLYYTPYQVIMWYTKSAEGFRNKPYEDGEYPSTGFGLNMRPGRKITSHPTWSQASQELSAFVGKTKDAVLHQNRFKGLNDWQIAALTLRFYNRGENSLPKFKPEYLLGCCGSTSGCGFTCRDKKKQKAVRASHTARRSFEYRLFLGRVTNEEIQNYRQKCIKMESSAQ